MLGLVATRAVIFLSISNGLLMRPSPPNSVDLCYNQSFCGLWRRQLRVVPFNNDPFAHLKPVYSGHININHYVRRWPPRSFHTSSYHCRQHQHATRRDVKGLYGEKIDQKLFASINTRKFRGGRDLDCFMSWLLQDLSPGVSDWACCGFAAFDDGTLSRSWCRSISAEIRSKKVVDRNDPRRDLKWRLADAGICTTQRNP